MPERADLNVVMDPSISNREEWIATGYNVIAFGEMLNAAELRKVSVEDVARRLSVWTTSTGSTSMREAKVFLGKPDVRLLSRLTVCVNDPSDIHFLSSPVLRHYDVVAVRPSTEKLLQQVLQADVDLVSVDLTQRLPFHLKRTQVHVARDKGIKLEICYAPLLRDPSARRNAIRGIVSLIRACGAQDIVVSSGALHTLELRRGPDVDNLMGFLFGLSNVSPQSTTTNALSAVEHGAKRRFVHKGMVRVIAATNADKTMVDNQNEQVKMEADG